MLFKTSSKYVPPTVKTTCLESEDALLASSSADVDRSLEIEGQETDGYFESNDIGSAWGWG